MINAMLIYADACSKLMYTCDFIFNDFFCEGYNITNDLERFKQFQGPKINFSKRIFHDAINIPDSNYFNDFNINTDPDFHQEIKYINDVFDFDLFAAVFFCLARVEEYRNLPRDSHDRFISNNSLLVKKEIYAWPVVDHWLITLADRIEKKFKTRLITKRKFGLISSVDVDHIHAYRSKPLPVQLGALCKDIIKFQWGRVEDRFAKTDPYDTFDDIIKWHNDLDLDIYFFLLTAKRSPFDKNLDPSSETFRNYAKKISIQGRLGIHPSYYSGQNSSLKTELKELQSIVAKDINMSRQHFLKIKLPQTYQTLLDAGIKEDYSMGYPDLLGFRAGTAQSFYWYNLTKNITTKLRVFPFMAMDVTLKKYLKLDAQVGLTQLKSLVDRTAQVDGQFGLIWHNSSFYERESWKGWPHVYKSILKYLADKIEK